MSYIINTSFKEQLSSVSFNRKIHTIVGENSVFNGFEVSIVNDEVIISEGQCTIEGACIESRYLNIPKKIPIGRYKEFLHLWVCFQYNHVAKSIKEIITVENPTGAYCLPIAKLEKHEEDEEYTIIPLNRVKTLASTNEAMNKAMDKVDEFDKTLEDFIKNQTEQHPSIAEVVEARGGEKSLKTRLDKSDEKHKKDYDTAIEDINYVKKEVQDARFGADTLADRLIYMMQHHERDKNEINASIGAIEDEILEARGENETLSDRLIGIEDNHKADKESLDTDITNIRTDISLINKEISDARGENETLVDELSSIKETINSNDDKASSSINEIQEEINNARDGLPTLSDKLNSMEVNHDSDMYAVNTELEDARAGEVKLGDRLNKIQDHADSNTERIEELEDLTSIWEEHTGDKNITVNDSLNGIVKGLSVKGMTLQNILKNKMYNFSSGIPSSEYQVVRKELSLTVTIESSSLEWRYINLGKALDNNIMAGKTYSVVCSSQNIDSISIMNADSTNNITESKRKISDSLFIFKVKDNAQLNQQIIYCGLRNSDKQIFIKDVMILEGDFSNKPIPNSYFEGIKSLGEAEDNKVQVKSTGKNLYSNKFLKTYESTAKITPTGLIVSGKWYTSMECPVFDISKTYRYSAKHTIINGDYKGRVIIYDRTTVRQVSDDFSIGGKIKLTSLYNPNNNNELIFYVGNGSSETTIEFSDVQIEESIATSEFEDHKSCFRKIPLPFDGGLKSLPNEVHDELKENEVVQKIGLGILDNKTNFIVANDCKGETTTVFATYDFNTLAQKNNGEQGTDILCNTFVNKRGSEVFPSTNDSEGIYISNGGNLYFRIKDSKLETRDVPGLKKWLQANPTTILFQLANPIMHNINAEYLRSYSKTTHITLENNIATDIKLFLPIDRDAMIEGNTIGIDNLDNKIDVINLDINTRIDEEVTDINQKIDSIDSETNTKIDEEIKEINKKIDTKSDKTHLHDDRYLKLIGGALTGALTLHSQGIRIPTTGGTWVSGKTTNTAIVATGNSGSSYHPILRYNHYSGNVSNIGVLGERIGFWGYLSATTENKNDAGAYLDIGTNTFYAGKFNGDGSSVTNVNATRLNGRTWEEGPVASSLVSRDSNGYVYARLFRSTYANQSAISGALAFRINDSSDNYIRFCSDKVAIQNWLGVLPLTGGSLTGELTLNNKDLKINGYSVVINKPSGTGGWARGMAFKSEDGETALGGFGMHGSGDAVNSLYIGLGATPYDASVGLTLTSSSLKFKGNEVYHVGRKPTLSELGAAAASHGTHVTYGGNGTATTVSRSDHSHPNITSRGRLATETGATRPDIAGLTLKEAYNSSGYPATYGNVITACGGGVGQLFMEWTGNTSTTPGRLFYRSKSDVGSTNYSDWVSIYTSANKPTAADVGARASNWVPAWGDVTGKPSTFAPIIGTASNQAAAGNHNHDSAYLGKTAKAADSSKLNGIVENVSSVANTIAKRDANGDINVRLLRSEYANQSTISGAMAFRTNNSSDNYIRYCSDATAIRNFIGAAAGSHTHSYLPLSGGTLTGILQSNSDIKTSGKMYVGASHNPVNNTPAITLALGDEDTGLNWISDGTFAVYTNSSELVRFNGDAVTIKTALYANHHIRLSSGQNVYLPNNTGIAGKDTSGADRYMMYMDTSNKIHIGYSKINDIYFDTNSVECHMMSMDQPSGGYTGKIRFRHGGATHSWIESVMNGDAAGSEGNYFQIGCMQGSTTRALLRVSADATPTRNQHNFVAYSSIHPSSTNNWALGWSSYRWKAIYLSSSPNVSSDANTKNHISYIDKDKAVLLRTPLVFDKDDKSTNIKNGDCLDFVKNIPFATYFYNNYKAVYEEGEETEVETELIESEDTDFNLGFIAQDVVNSKIGNVLCTKDENGSLGYNLGTYSSIIGKAVQELAENQETEMLALEEENTKLKTKVTDLESRLQALEDMILNQ